MKKSYICKVKDVGEAEGIGLIKGVASTFGNVDQTGDIIAPGAFDASLAELKARKEVLPSFLNHDMNLQIGGIDPDDLQVTSSGLQVTIKVDLDTRAGKDCYSLVKKGFLNNFSVGFNFDYKDDAIEYDYSADTRTFNKVNLFEVSITPLPANKDATINEVKSVTSFKDYPLASKDTAWDSSAAIKRVRAKTDSEDSPSSSYKNAFMWFDSSDTDSFGAYKLPYVDVIDGELKVIPRAIFAIASVLQGGRGGVDIPDADKAKIKAHVNRYYKKLDMDSPFDNSEKCLTMIQELKNLHILQSMIYKLREG